MKYTFHKEYFVSNNDEVVMLSGKNTVSVGFNSNLSQKVLGKLYTLGKPYVALEGDGEVIEKPKPKVKSKKKKVKIDEPKAKQEETISNDTDPNEEES
jgi:hypothetical protein